MTDQPRSIRYVVLADVQPAVRNPRSHLNLADVKDSIRTSGFVEGAVLDGRTGRIVAGHGRLQALVEMETAGEPLPDGIVADGGGRWMLPVQVGWSSADDESAERMVVWLNRSPEVGGWDDRALVDVLRDLEASGGGLTGTGFDDDELADLQARLASIHVNEHERRRGDPDAVPTVEGEAGTAWGDVWQLGPHRVMVGDATSADDVVRLFAGEKPQAMLTDPPYCSGGFQEAGRASGSIGTDAKIKPRVANDTLSTRGYMALIKEIISRAGVPILYVFTDWRMWVNLFDVVESSGYGARNMIVWDKGSPGMGAGWRTQHELIMYAVSATVKFDNHKAQGNVIAAQRTGNPLHPTQKPVDLLAKILAVTDMAQTIYDPFAGSGSTLIACEQEGRVARLMEIDPAHVAVICRRWEEFTGEKPVLEATGEPRSFVG